MPQDIILAPSLLSSDFGRLAEELAALEQAGLPWVHWDVMDGRFVPNITLGPPIIKAVRKRSKLFFDVHLMIKDPGRYVQEFADAGADLICVHAEACTHLDRVVAQIREAGARPGVALNPHTPLDHVHYLLPDLHMVLVMSVNPGFGGQEFIPYCLDKVAGLKQMIATARAPTLIQVDGGVSPENTFELVSRGADVLVSGSSFFNHPPYRERHQAFLEAARKGRTGPL